MSERTPKDFAIEHGLYLSATAQQFLHVANCLVEELVDGHPAEHLDRFAELWSVMHDSIYQFEKRAARAYKPQGNRIDYLAITKDIVAGNITTDGNTV